MLLAQGTSSKDEAEPEFFQIRPYHRESEPVTTMPDWCYGRHHLRNAPSMITFPIFSAQVTNLLTLPSNGCFPGDREPTPRWIGRFNRPGAPAIQVSAPWEIPQNTRVLSNGTILDSPAIAAMETVHSWPVTLSPPPENPSPPLDIHTIPPRTQSQFIFRPVQANHPEQLRK